MLCACVYVSAGKGTKMLENRSLSHQIIHLRAPPSSSSCFSVLFFLSHTHSLTLRIFDLNCLSLPLALAQPTVCIRCVAGRRTLHWDHLMSSPINIYSIICPRSLSLSSVPHPLSLSPLHKSGGRKGKRK